MSLTFWRGPASAVPPPQRPDRAAAGWLARALVWTSLARTLPASAGTSRVQPGADLQAAIDRAAPGDVIEIERGTYRGNFRIDKPLTLRGLHRPTLSGELRGDTVRITAPDVTLEGLLVRDSGDSLKDQNAGIYIQPGAHRTVVRQCALSYNLFGLWIETANDVLVEDSLIVGKRDYASVKRGNGIQLYNTRGARILHNNISFVRDALYVDVSHHAVFRGNRLHHSRYGTHYMNAHHNLWEDNDSYLNRGGLALMGVRDQVVRNNRAWANSDHGIMLRTLQGSLIEGNVVAGNHRGFFLFHVAHTTLRDNLVVDNRVGVHLAANAIGNVVERNDFIGNREQVRYAGTRDVIWGGNHWSNYLGWDRDGDGIGDIPYEASDLVDRLTWRHPSVKLLMGSPALQSLRLVGRQFPVLRVPGVVDPSPRMRPGHPRWRHWHGTRFPAP